MTSRDFAFWLQGYFEISNIGEEIAPMTSEQVGMIKKHLNLVFKHEIDSSMGDGAHQQILNDIHQTSPFTGYDKPREKGIMRC